MAAGRFAAIILSGGLSSRMQGFKPLLPLGDETITDHVISLFLNCGVEVLLVTGHRSEDLLAGIKNRDILAVKNPDYEKGMFNSIRAGIRQLKPEHQAFFIMPVDIPLVRASTIKRLLDESIKHPDKFIYPVFRQRRGHPPLLPSNVASTIMEWDQGGGLKSVLLSQEVNTLEVNVPDKYILFDIDTWEDYESLLGCFQRYKVPTEEECEVILKDIYKIAPGILRHCQKVSEVAVAIGKKLKEAGQNIDIRLVRTSSLLHDIAKGQPRHDVIGGEILREWGFGKAGDIVAAHTDLAGGDDDITLEQKIVYLADKFIEEEKLVSIEDRFQSSAGLYGSNPEVENKILRRKMRALNTKRELEHLLGYPLEKIVDTITHD